MLLREKLAADKTINFRTRIKPSELSLGAGKSCRSDKKRSILKARLKELVKEARSIPENCLPESGESKPEPEVVAAAMIMSEGEDADHGKTKPGKHLDKVLLQVLTDDAAGL